MMTPDEHIQEVLDRGTGWERRSQWLVLEAKPGGWEGHVAVIHCPPTGMWGVVWVGHGSEAVFDLPPDEVFTFDADAKGGHFRAADAADEAEELVRVRGLSAAERSVRS